MRTDSSKYNMQDIEKAYEVKKRWIEILYENIIKRGMLKFIYKFLKDNN